VQLAGFGLVEPDDLVAKVPGGLLELDIGLLPRLVDLETRGEAEPGRPRPARLRPWGGATDRAFSLDGALPLPRLILMPAFLQALQRDSWPSGKDLFLSNSPGGFSALQALQTLSLMA
jgi:hypothetical protein